MLLKQMKNGLSLRKIHTWMIVIAVILSCIMVFSTYRVMRSFIHLTDVTEEQMVLENAAHELLNASDYLTERVQRFTITGDPRFMEEYFAEAFETRRREKAVDIMKKDPDAAAPLEALREAMSYSIILMNREYYAMRLVIDAKGYTQYPTLLRSVSLRQNDAALSPAEKMKLAMQTVMDDEYYKEKDRIRQGIRKSVAAIETLTHNAKEAALSDFRVDLSFGRTMIVLQILLIFFVVWLTSFLGISPILRAVDQIKADSPIPEVGANEFRYLAQAYNKMYSVYKSSIEHLNFKASHDELTGAYNRAGYELLLSGMDIRSTYMLLFDVDHFKTINDTYGHETGDKILIKLVKVLKSHFRSDDYICRIGGDEFVVFMVHSDEMQRSLIESKISRINNELANPTDGLPPVSISAGIAHGIQTEDAAKLFEKCDLALYESKKRGRHTYTFYRKSGDDEMLRVSSNPE